MSQLNQVILNESASEIKLRKYYSECFHNVFRRKQNQHLESGSSSDLPSQELSIVSGTFAIYRSYVTNSACFQFCVSR